MSRMKLRLIIFGIALLVVGVNSLLKQFRGDGDKQVDATPADPNGEVVDITPNAAPSATLSDKYYDLAEVNRGVLKGREEVEIVGYLIANGTLPDSFITKNEARELGWVASEGNLREVAPGKSIGGDRFMNREKELPDAPGRKYFEADLNYQGGSRGAERLVYSDDGLIFVTRDHYRTFKEVRLLP
ncbi:ribonuclease domain-containing protein [Bremerella sp. P1]|uniref:ribonuclease domain-containing protein n=1 Tax=Bremerella sp. P1 TaxID=3026424 RepID=UPI0023689F4F|nr:ribonuclease domain-containing protein [Bremerella sp. P1]WDI42997.1 ribonuclease domain-containing protein [Bremerella sp. P1]